MNRGSKRTNEKKLIPQLPLRFLSWFCPDHLSEEIEGDLLQRYERDVLKFGGGKAKWRLLWDVIKFFRPGILLRNKLSNRRYQFLLIRNYFMMVMRLFERQKIYSLINIFGLSVGLAASFLIFLYVQDELSYDQYFEDADKIYRVGITEKFEGKETHYTETSSPLAEAMQNEIPEVISTTRISWWPNQLVNIKERSFIEKHFLLADSSFFSIFSYKLVEGNEKECLNGPNKIILTESTARRYFGYQSSKEFSPVGQFVAFEGDQPVEVTGIIQDPPENTHMKFDVILSLDTWDNVAKDDCWSCYGVHTYFKLNDKEALDAVERKLDNFVNNRVFPRIEKDLNVTRQQMDHRGDKISFFIQPITSIHLGSHFDGEFEPNSDRRYVALFGAVAVFIILIAIINFMNLATARGGERAKEIGVRKTLGALRSVLVEQFMIETCIYVIASTAISTIMVASTIQPFNLLAGKNLQLDLLRDPSTWIIIILFILLVSLGSGSYPAFYLTSFESSAVIKGKLNRGLKHLNIRNGLVVFQFVISLGLIISTVVIYRQLKFVQQLNLGFNRENVISIKQIMRLGDNTEAFKTELLKHSEFLNASYAFRLPLDISNDFFVKTEESDHLYSCFHTSVDYDHLETMGLELKSGRFFSKDFLADSSSVVINETCAKLLDYENYEGRFIMSRMTKYKVVGIVKDFKFESIRNKVKPLVIFLNRNPVMMALRFAPGNVDDKIKLAESIWKEFNTDSPFQYSFIDDDFNALYRSEQKMSKVFWMMTALAIFIACLGLFGLITFISNQRTKEIGIRKVMGASVGQIVVLLSGSFVRLAAIAFIIAIPLALFGMNEWLKAFAYRTTLDLSLILIICILGILITLVAVGYKSFQAALRNPVESLRNE